jgi:hypothetical protein
MTSNSKITIWTVRLFQRKFDAPLFAPDPMILIGILESVLFSPEDMCTF